MSLITTRVPTLGLAFADDSDKNLGYILISQQRLQDNQSWRTANALIAADVQEICLLSCESEVHCGDDVALSSYG